MNFSLTESETFYQLGCGDQPKGWMGDLSSVDVTRNGATVHRMLDAVFESGDAGNRVLRTRLKAYATAAVALGTLAYGQRQGRDARRWLWRAMWADPALVFRRRWATLWVKSLLGPRILDWLRVRRQRMASSG